MTEGAPRRVLVTGPRTRRLRGGRPYAVSREIDEQTALGEVFMRSLMRAQLRLGLLLCGGLTVLLGGLPLLFTLVPELRRVRLLGLNLPWLLLGFVVYPVLVAGAWFYVRQAERNEQDFSELVERS